MCPHPLKLSAFIVDPIHSCEKGKPLERVGRKASGLIKTGSGVAQRQYLRRNEPKPILSSKGWVFY
jgi:hypothetical protein